MVWGMITPHRLGQLVRIEGNMHKELYRKILQDNFLDTMDNLELDVHDYYFQQDNDPKHKAGIMKKWFEENNFALFCDLLVVPSFLSFMGSEFFCG
jgi:hypothetical protein